MKNTTGKSGSFKDHSPQFDQEWDAAANLKSNSQLKSAERSTQDEEKFHKQHQEYIAKRIARRNEEKKMCRQQFQSSSSDEEVIKVKINNQDNLTTKLTINSPKMEGKTLKMQILLRSKKNPNNWISQSLSFKQNSMDCSSVSFSISEIRKLKVIFEEVEQRYKIKITIGAEEFFLAASVKCPVQSKYMNFGEHYYIFAKIIFEKTQELIKTKDKADSFQNEPRVHIKARVLRKSRLLGNWKQRFITINEEGLLECDNKAGKAALLIPRGSIKELWTRFEPEQGMLIVKTFLSKTKIEFAINFENFLDRSCLLYHIYGLWK